MRLRQLAGVLGPGRTAILLPAKGANSGSTKRQVESLTPPSCNAGAAPSILKKYSLVLAVQLSLLIEEVGSNRTFPHSIEVSQNDSSPSAF